ncbi:m7GpppX diphosphatase-like [Symsagittifera roscoffensis]|uniref:m7GpppX diphosphatase-like n=1 Tax=Symsagittifera roscoffensis TaxID=84072 RepID=UPI00307C6677
MKRASDSNGASESHPTPEKMSKTELSDQLSNFKLVKQLNCHNDTKTIFLQVEKEEKMGVIILEKQPFDDKIAEEVLSEDLRSQVVFSNDIYSTHKVLVQSKATNEIKTTLIYPAIERHILKYSAKDPFVFEETPQLYSDFVKPFFEKEALNCQWVYNILEKKSESERIICEDADPQIGFVCVPDLRANDLSDVQTFHAVAIVNRRDLMSIRDLNASHLDLLRNVQKLCLKGIKEKFSFGKEKLRVFLHYQPSFYHLHIHFASIHIQGTHVQVERAHLLSDVIQNLEMQSNFYQKKTMTYVVNQQDPLMEVIRENVITEAE